MLMRIKPRTLVKAALIGVALYCFAAWLIAGQLISPAPHVVGPPPAGMESVSFKSESGSTIAGWYSPPTKHDATIILLHPLRGDRRTMLNRHSLLNAEGYGTLLIDLQAHGESPGNAITVGHLESRDVTAAIEWVRSTTPSSSIGIVGWSLGGASLLLAEPTSVAAIVLESVYPTVSEAVHNRVALRLGPLHHVIAPMLLVQLKPRLGITPEMLRPINSIKTLTCPLLIMAGSDDQHTPLFETKALFNSAVSEKSLEIFDGAAHVDLQKFDPERYAKAVVSFFDKHLLTK